ncbi:MAG: hypothetical protein Q8R26_00315 [bacterium]|nr:hypothetical protein [bacterium]
MAFRNQSADSGISLLEVVLSMTILATLLGIGLPVSFDFYATYQFDSEFKMLVSLLEHARNSAMINLNESPHGLFIDQNNFTVFQGSSYATRAVAFDKVFPRSNGVPITGLSEIVFSQLSGQTSGGTFTISYNATDWNIFVNTHGTISF